MSQEFDCHYGEAEFNTIKAGIKVIETVLTGTDIHAKERLLYCLDWEKLDAPVYCNKL